MHKDCWGQFQRSRHDMVPAPEKVQSCWSCRDLRWSFRFLVSIWDLSIRWLVTKMSEALLLGRHSWFQRTKTGQFSCQAFLSTGNVTYWRWVERERKKEENETCAPSYGPPTEIALLTGDKTARRHAYKYVCVCRNVYITPIQKSACHFWDQTKSWEVRSCDKSSIRNAVRINKKRPGKQLTRSFSSLLSVRIFLKELADSELWSLHIPLQWLGSGVEKRTGRRPLQRASK